MIPSINYEVIVMNEEKEIKDLCGQILATWIINNGKKDGGIDIIGWNSEKVLLIQCKNYRSQINQDLLRKFIGDCKIYEEKNKYKIKDREIKRIFASNSTADYGADRFLNENRNILEFLRIQAECR